MYDGIIVHRGLLQGILVSPNTAEHRSLVDASNRSMF